MSSSSIILIFFPIKMLQHQCLRTIFVSHVVAAYFVEYAIIFAGGWHFSEKFVFVFLKEKTKLFC